MKHFTSIFILSLNLGLASKSFALVEGQWLGANDFQGVAMQFKDMQESGDKPLVLKHDWTQNIDLEKGPSDKRKQVRMVYSRTIDNNESQCVFYDVKLLSYNDEIHPEPLRLNSTSTVTKQKKVTFEKYSEEALDTWTFNQSEPVPGMWADPGIFPLSFSLKSKGRHLKVLCSTKKHLSTHGTYQGQAAFTSYALLLKANGINLSKDGKDFEVYKKDIGQTQDSKSTLVDKKVLSQATQR